MIPLDLPLFEPWEVKTRKRRKAPRLDPVKSAAKIVAKNPDLVMRLKLPGDGELEIANKKAAPVKNTNSNEIESDAAVGNDVWDAIAAIRNGGIRGPH